MVSPASDLHGHVVDAAALAAMALARLGDEAHAEAAGRDVGDLAVLGHVRWLRELQANAMAESASVKM